MRSSRVGQTRLWVHLSMAYKYVYHCDECKKCYGHPGASIDPIDQPYKLFTEVTVTTIASKEVYRGTIRGYNYNEFGEITYKVMPKNSTFEIRSKHRDTVRLCG